MLKKFFTGPFRPSYNAFIEDINSDGDEEIMIYSGDEEQLVVMNTSLEKLAEAEVWVTLDPAGSIKEKKVI